jgi:hypothetical protein
MSMEKSNQPAPKKRHLTWVLAVLTLLCLLLSVPVSLRYARDNGGFYLLSSAFYEDIPKRLTGPGRFRFILQPLVALIVGTRGGLADARTGLPPYVYTVLFHPDPALRRQQMRSGFLSIANLVLMGILVDSICQWLILGISYPGAALAVGPVLIAAPYVIARALANRCARFS